MSMVRPEPEFQPGEWAIVKTHRWAGQTYPVLKPGQRVQISKLYEARWHGTHGWSQVVVDEGDDPDQGGGNYIDESALEREPAVTESDYADALRALGVVDEDRINEIMSIDL